MGARQVEYSLAGQGAGQSADPRCRLEAGEAFGALLSCLFGSPFQEVLLFSQVKSTHEFLSTLQPLTASQRGLTGSRCCLQGGVGAALAAGRCGCRFSGESQHGMSTREDALFRAGRHSGLSGYFKKLAFPGGTHQVVELMALSIDSS